jgi:hypothetical protein
LTGGNRDNRGISLCFLCYLLFTYNFALANTRLGILNNLGRFMSRRSPLSLCAVSLAVIATGCGGEPSPEFGRVSGVVKINGRPQPRLSVRFSPDAEKGNGLPATATGISDAQGKYSLKYEFRGEEGEGAPVGWHRVSVIDTAVGHTPQGQQPKPSAVPYQYSNPSTSPITKEVKPGEQTIDIDVKR